MTVIEGSSSIVPDVLFRLCVSSAVSGRNALFVDGWNNFNPYALSKIAKSFGAEPRKVLSRIHVARAFTEYQMSRQESRITNCRIATPSIWGNPTVIGAGSNARV